MAGGVVSINLWGKSCRLQLKEIKKNLNFITIAFVYIFKTKNIFDIWLQLELLAEPENFEEYRAIESAFQDKLNLEVDRASYDKAQVEMSVYTKCDHLWSPL